MAWKPTKDAALCMTDTGVHYCYSQMHWIHNAALLAGNPPANKKRAPVWDSALQSVLYEGNLQLLWKLLTANRETHCAFTNLFAFNCCSEVQIIQVDFWPSNHLQHGTVSGTRAMTTSNKQAEELLEVLRKKKKMFVIFD